MSVGTAQTPITAVRPLRRLTNHWLVPAKDQRIRLAFISEGFDGASADNLFRDAITSLWDRVQDRTAFASSFSQPQVGVYYHRETLAGATGAGPDPSPGGELGIDQTAFENTIANILFPTSMDFLLGAVDASIASGLTETIAIVYMPTPGNRAAKARIIMPGDPIEHGNPASARAQRQIVLLEKSPQDHIVVLRVIAEALGLRPEFDVAAADDPTSAFLRPADIGEAVRAKGPNLIYRTNFGDLDYDLALDLIVQQGLSIATMSTSVGTPEIDIEEVSHLFEGGAGFRHDIYRTAPDCIMRRRLSPEYLGTGTDPLDYTNSTFDLDFCPACHKVMTERLASGWNNTKTDLYTKKCRFYHQRHHFEEITWSNARKGETFDQAFGTGVRTYSSAATPNWRTGHYWDFDMAVDERKGLTFAELINQRPSAGISLPVADALEFRDFQVLIEPPGGASLNKTPFDLQPAFDAGTVELRFGSEGRAGADRQWQHGFFLKATLEVAGLVEVTVEQSVCFRAGSNDFDPTRAVVALKIYPELCFSYRPLQSGAKVKSFHGTVWQVIRPRSSHAVHGTPVHQTPATHSMADMNKVWTSWFTEMDVMSAPLDAAQRTRLGPVDTGKYIAWAGPPLGFYAGLFGYWMRQESGVPTHSANGTPAPTGQPAGDTEIEVLGVRHRSDIRSGSNTHDWEWPPGYYVTIDREDREGEYDNVHTHGWMGVASNPVPPTAQAPGALERRMAPVCGEACVHLHWRWLHDAFKANRAVSQGAAIPYIGEMYWGWGNDPATATSHEVAGHPLVPPNQRVRIAITDPATGRVPANSQGELSTILNGTTNTEGVRVAAAIDDEARALWYDVDIEGDIKAGAKNVIFEQGWGYAADHALLDPFNNIPIQPATIQQLRSTAWAFSYDEFPNANHANDNFHDVMMFVYDCWQFHLNGTEQIPHGDHVAPFGSQSMEKF